MTGARIASCSHYESHTPLPLGVWVVGQSSLVRLGLARRRTACSWAELGSSAPAGHLARKSAQPGSRWDSPLRPIHSISRGELFQPSQLLDSPLFGLKVGLPDFASGETRPTFVPVVIDAGSVATRECPTPETPTEEFPCQDQLSPELTAPPNRRAS